MELMMVLSHTVTKFILALLTFLFLFTSSLVAEDKAFDEMTQVARNKMVTKVIPIIYDDIIILVIADTVAETGTITHNGTTYGTVTSPYTGKVWLDRNLGADQVCTAKNDTACYGDYYQWGRNYDGHQESNSFTTSTQATNINNPGINFIIGDFDWANTDADGSLRSANWSKTDGSSVCPTGYRVPTVDELKAELLDAGSAEISNRDEAFNSFLALPSSGIRTLESATMDHDDYIGSVWANSVGGSFSLDIYFGYGKANWSIAYRATGASVRCLRD